MAFWNRKKKTEDRATETSGGESCSIEQLFSTAEMTRAKALQIPSVSAAINKLALTVAKLPVKLYRTDNEKGKPIEVKDDNRTRLLSIDCGDTLSIVNFWHSVIEDYYLGKGAFVYIDKYQGDWRSLRYVDCTKVSVSTNTDPIFKDFDIYVNGVRYFPFDFIKIHRKTVDGAQSTPLTDENSRILSVAYETLQFEKKQIQKGGNKRGFFKSAKRLAGDSLKELKETVRVMNSNNDDAERATILNDGIDFKETSSTSVELQLNENKKTNADEIFSLFGFPASVIRGNATETDKELFVDSVVELLTVIEAALDKDLLLENEKSTKYFAFDTKELTRGKMKERFEGYEIALRNHFMQRDEVRAIEELEPLGFNYIELGLGDVLLDPKTKEIFVPNTGQTGKLGKMKGGEKE